MSILNTLKSGAAVAALAVSLITGNAVAQDMPPRVIGSVQVDEQTTAGLQFAIEVELEASPAEVWEYVSDSMNLAEMSSSVDSVSVVGNIRTLTMADGETVVEIITADDDGSMTFAYTLAADNVSGLVNHLAVVQVRPADVRDGSVVSWSQFFDHPESDSVQQGMIPGFKQAMTALTEKFGGYISGSNDGFAKATIQQTRIINTSAEAVWAEVADNYANVHEWSSFIAKVEIEDGEGVVGDVRVCFIPALGGATREIVTRYDEDAGIFAYTVEQGLPPFVVGNEAVWSVKPIDADSAEVSVTITMDVAPGVPPQAVGFTRSSFFGAAGIGIDELKFFVEEGQPHPREIASRS